MDWVQHACKQGKGLDWSEHQNLLQNQSHTTKNKSFRFFRTRFLFFFCSFPNPINSIYLIYLLQPDCVRINDSSTPHFSDVISPSLLAGGMGLINGKTWPYIMEWKPLKEGAYSLHQIDTLFYGHNLLTTLETNLDFIPLVPLENRTELALQ